MFLKFLYSIDTDRYLETPALITPVRFQLNGVHRIPCDVRSITKPVDGMYPNCSFDIMQGLLIIMLNDAQMSKLVKTA